MKLAVERKIQGPDGKVQSYYIDLTTLQVVQNPADYKIISTGGQVEVTQDGTPHTPVVDTGGAGLSGYDAIMQAQHGAPAPTSVISKEGADPMGIKPPMYPGEGEGTMGQNMAGKKPGDATNNFGYINKPAWAGLLGALPGPLGTVGKLGNMAVNASNTMATNTARGMLGLPEKDSVRDTIGGVMKDNKGKVADVEIGGEDYAVGLEAESPSGRTTLTPDEARVRGAIVDKNFGPAKEISRPDKNRGIIGSVVDSIFGGEDRVSSLVDTQSRETAATGGNATTRAQANNEPAGFMGHPNNPADVDYSGVGPNRPHAANAAFTGGVLSAARGVVPGTTLGVTSGDVNPTDAGWTAEGGKYSKSHRHTDEMGIDTQYTDPQTGGFINDALTMSDIGMAQAAVNPTVGLGYGPGYMGNDVMHVDASQK